MAVFGGNLDELLDGVTSVVHSPTPGPVYIFGTKAFPVLIGNASGTKLPVAGACLSGSGRIVAVGDNGFGLSSSLVQNTTGRFMKNIVKWVAGSKASPRIATTPGKDKDEFQTFLVDNGFNAHRLPANAWIDSLNAYDVVFCNGDQFSVSDTARLRAWIHGGGGLIIQYAGWVWGSYGPVGHNDLTTDLPGNVLLESEGMMFGGDYVDPTGSGVYIVSNPPDPLTHARWALDTLIRHNAATIAIGDTLLAQSLSVNTKCINILPLSDTFLLQRLETMTPAATPSIGTPVNKTDYMTRLSWTYQTIKAKRAPADVIIKSPAVAAFPGNVGTGAPRITKTIAVNTDVWDWHSTGLYAAAGEVIIMTFPSNAVSKGFEVQIGSHTDGLWNKDSWVRCPDIVRRYPVKQARVEAASAFGGLIYIVAPKGSGLGVISVSIQNAIQAPYFKLGQTTAAEWRSTLRNAPVPWAELACDNFIMTLPADSLRTLDDPDSIMTYWDKIMHGYSSLLGWSWSDHRPERMVLDADIQLGWLHSGYPFMGYVAITRDNVTMNSLKYNNWGAYHELGHNFQVGSWTFGGGGEITNNIQILYLYDLIADTAYQSLKDWKSGNAGNDRDQRLSAYFKGKSHEGVYSFQSVEAFTGLLFYIELQEGFGWDAFKNVFKSYIGQPAIDNDQEKRDQWLIRFSKAAGRDLSRFFEIWGIPVTSAAKRQVAGPALWIHPELSKYTGVTAAVAARKPLSLEPVFILANGRMSICLDGQKLRCFYGTVYSLSGAKIADLQVKNKGARLEWNHGGSFGQSIVLVRITMDKTTISKKLCVM